ncbi:Mitotic spindle organizing protein 1 [Nesidiocoris tenuis]|uniref:Mitotic spindle organizing protein 1 n=1 Tax=Nesidiocoris tenuis TaxID=355587 RepID=A0ABN7AJP6_9HEMI|nr:Mitotic spindle organizing protein 1 [Nesidiocoris tenuis]
MPENHESVNGVDNETDSAKTMFKAIKEISDTLETNLDAESLRICLRLINLGMNPETLSKIVLDVRKEVQHYRTKKRFSASNLDGQDETA